MKIAVTLSTTPSDDSARMSSLADCPLVLVTGIFTFTFGPQAAIVRACSAMLGEIVGEDLERDRPVGDRGQHLAREGLVVGDAGLSHQRRIGGEPLDQRVSRHLDDAVVVGTVGENLDLEIGDPAHGASCAVRVALMMTSAASAIERTT